MSDITSPATAAEIAGTARPAWSRRKAVLRALRHRSLSLGLVLFILLVLAAFSAPWLTSFDPTAQEPMATFTPPGGVHLMGTDAFGRDLFARVLFGARTTILASISVVVLGAIVGTVLGLVAGYFGGTLGFSIMRLIDLLLAFPGILLALTVTTILGPGLTNGVIAIAAILVPIFARLVEGATAEVRNLPYVEAATAAGASSARIIFKHILPNVMSGVIVLTTTWLGIAALWITALGFIGLGVQPPRPELGAILNDGQNYIMLAWWITVFPGLFLSLFVISVNLIGDGLRDELDPTLNRL
ncbi:ABC transporter permease [Bosea sp. BK604]|uniref:ABC transporter permease n=1 Tax=Bosea sp. BK604 TaxID=2512180 RepID=UPI00104E59D8|nr:ABC transporter permease [Bosea sp. BK604]TCR70321.1 peptide/nickel transport system permease protein [Bosea sp. BK604]